MPGLRNFLGRLAQKSKGTLDLGKLVRGLKGSGVGSKVPDTTLGIREIVGKLRGSGGRAAGKAHMAIVRKGLETLNKATLNGGLSGTGSKQPIHDINKTTKHITHGWLGGLSRRKAFEKAYDALSDKEAIIIRDKIRDIMHDPKAEVTAMSKIVRAVREGKPPASGDWNTIKKYIDAAGNSTALPIDKVTDELRDAVGKAYNTLLSGSRGGPGSYNVSNDGRLAIDKIFRPGTATETWRNSSSSKGSALTNGASIGYPGSGESNLNFITLGKAGEAAHHPRLKGYRLSGDIGVTGHNQAGVFNIEDPVSGSMRDEMELAYRIAESKIPMGAVASQNIIDGMQRTLKGTPMEKELVSRGWMPAHWFRPDMMAASVPKAIMTNSAAKDNWMEIADSSNMRFINDRSIVHPVYERLSREGLADLKLEADIHNAQTGLGLSQPTQQSSANGTLNVMPEKRYAFDAIPGSREDLNNGGTNAAFFWAGKKTNPYTHIDSEKAWQHLLEQLSGKSYKELQTLSDDDLLTTLKKAGLSDDMQQDIWQWIREPRQLIDSRKAFNEDLLNRLGLTKDELSQFTDKELTDALADAGVRNVDSVLAGLRSGKNKDIVRDIVNSMHQLRGMNESKIRTLTYPEFKALLDNTDFAGEQTAPAWEYMRTGKKAVPRPLNTWNALVASIPQQTRDKFVTDSPDDPYWLDTYLKQVGVLEPTAEAVAKIRRPDNRALTAALEAWVHGAGLPPGMSEREALRQLIDSELWKIDKDAFMKILDKHVISDTGNYIFRDLDKQASLYKRAGWVQSVKAGLKKISPKLYGNLSKAKTSVRDYIRTNTPQAVKDAFKKQTIVAADKERYEQLRNMINQWRQGQGMRFIDAWRNIWKATAGKQGLAEKLKAAKDPAKAYGRVLKTRAMGAGRALKHPLQTLKNLMAGPLAVGYEAGWEMNPKGVTHDDYLARGLVNGGRDRSVNEMFETFKDFQRAKRYAAAAGLGVGAYALKGDKD